MKEYIKIDDNGKHKVRVVFAGIEYFEYHDTAEQANTSIIEDYKEEREGNLFR